MVGLGLYVFPALLIGGMDSIVGVMVGALVLAIIQSTAATFLGGAWIDVAAYITMLVVLMVRPFGFFGTPEYRRL
jgi:branched-chain amino acid transport system permease protein